MRPNSSRPRPAPHRCELLRRLALSAVAALLVAACGGPLDEAGGDDPADEETHDHGDGYLHSVSLADAGEVARTFDEGRATFDAPVRFRQVSLIVEMSPETELQWRAHRDGERPGRWKPVEITWREGRSHVGRALLERPADRIELRASRTLDSAYLEFSERITARTAGPLTRELPRAGTDELDGDYRTTRQLEAPDSLVVSRTEWGARDPNKICGSKHNPYRMTIHHTGTPSSDGGDPAKRMREIQAFHIDNRGWCDIGYHFVVSQSAKVFQGRSTEKRTGAHVRRDNTGNIGISLIGNFDDQTVGSDQFRATTRIVNWVHETYSIPLDRDRVRGHREWPTGSTSCPGENLLNRLDELLRKSENPDGSGTEWDVRIDAGLVDSDNPYDQGSSTAIPDAFPGDGLRAEIVVKNASPEPIREVRLGYLIETPHLRPTGYTIYDDHPEYDQKSWSVNDSNSADANPESLSSDGRLTLYAFSSGESKRVLVDLEATTYSLGAIHHPDVRGWIRHIKDVYGTKEGWNDSVSTNEIGGELRDFAQVDVPSRNEWRFENEDTQENLEGWTGCCSGDYEYLEVNRDVGAMAMKVSGPDPRLESPSWTRIDASAYDQLVVRLRSHDGSHSAAVYWKREGESFADSRSFRFEAPGDGDFHTLAVPVGEDPEWSGTITGLRIDPLDSGATPGSGASRWYDIDGMYVRSSETGETSTDRETYGGATTVEHIDGNTDEPDDTDDPEDGSGGNVQRSASPDEVRVKGCTAGGRSTPIPAGILVVLVGWLALRRRQSIEGPASMISRVASTSNFSKLS